MCQVIYAFPVEFPFKYLWMWQAHRKLLQTMSTWAHAAQWGDNSILFALAIEFFVEAGFANNYH